jgi:universal stress protein E
MKSIRKILVAIKDPSAASQPALRKAAQLATALGARLELFHAIDTPVYVDAFAASGKSAQQVQKSWRDAALKRLERHADKLRAGGLTVSCDAEWDFPAYEAVLRGARNAGAQLIVAERHADRHRAAWLLRFNDWELLRRSPLPVLLVKSPQAWESPAVIAAIDPQHLFSKPAKLDGGILDIATVVAGALGGKLHAVHAFMPAVVDFGSLDLSQENLVQRIEEAAQAKARAGFDRALDGSNLPAAQRHLVEGPATDVIPATAKKLRAKLVVMGAISRSGIKRLLLGNTAERVLDALTCDVLVVKPADFKAGVPRGRRGMKLLATPLMT